MFFFPFSMSQPNFFSQVPTSPIIQNPTIMDLKTVMNLSAEFINVSVFTNLKYMLLNIKNCSK